MAHFIKYCVHNWHQLTLHILYRQAYRAKNVFQLFWMLRRPRIARNVPYKLIIHIHLNLNNDTTPIFILFIEGWRAAWTLTTPNSLEWLDSCQRLWNRPDNPNSFSNLSACSGKPLDIRNTYATRECPDVDRVDEAVYTSLGTCWRRQQVLFTRRQNRVCVFDRSIVTIDRHGKQRSSLAFSLPEPWLQTQRKITHHEFVTILCDGIKIERDVDVFYVTSQTSNHIQENTNFVNALPNKRKSFVLKIVCISTFMFGKLITLKQSSRKGNNDTKSNTFICFWSMHDFKIVSSVCSNHMHHTTVDSPTPPPPLPTARLNNTIMK